MMRTIILVTAVLLSMLSTVYAQRVESALTVEGHPVINCDGMSSSAYTITPKGNTEAVLKTVAANEKVYKRFAVSNSNNSTSANLSNAFFVCSNLSGSGWRLPTQRELALVWVCKRELNLISGFTQFDAFNYWSATEDYSPNHWAMNFELGYGESNNKAIGNRVRCVRELTP